MNLHEHTFTVESGRCITVDGVPFITLHRCGNDSQGYTFPLTEADRFAHQIVALIECSNGIHFFITRQEVEDYQI